MVCRIEMRLWQSHHSKHFQNNVFGTLLLRMGLLCRADDYVSYLDRAALRAMTGPKGESAVILFGIFIQLLKPCGAIHNLAYSGFRTPITVFPYVQLFVHPLPFVLRRIDRPLYQLLSDCASGWWVNRLFYNHFTPSELLRELKVHLVLQNRIKFGIVSKSDCGFYPARVKHE